MNQFWRRISLGGALLLAAILAGCAPQTEEHGHNVQNVRKFIYKGFGPITITATTGMVNDIVKNVGGKRVQSQALMGAGIDPHLYKATPGDIQKLTGADMLFYNGLHLEGKMADILAKMSSKKPSVAVADDIPEAELLKGDQTTQYPDPHVWFDVRKWMQATEVVRDALIAFDPPHAAEYKKNAETYLAQLKELDEYAREQLATIPKERRVLVTAHDAFRYFGKAYDVEVMGLQGLSTASEVSLKDVQRITNLLAERKIKAVFVETSVPQRAIQSVIQGARQKGHTVVVGGELFSDAMGKAGTPEGTYIGMVRHNVGTIVEALK